MFSLSGWSGELSPSVRDAEHANLRLRTTTTVQDKQKHDYPYRDVETGGCNTSEDVGSTSDDGGSGGSITPPLCSENLDSSNSCSLAPPTPIQIPPASSASSAEDDVIRFRPLQETDREEIQRLHEDWFPVRYQEEFFNDVVHNKMKGLDHPLYSCVAVRVPNNDAGSARSERIVGCIVGSFVEVARCNSKSVELLVPNPQRHSRMFYIMTLGVVKDYRGKGLASSLVGECSRMIEEDATCGVLYLHVITYNKAAIEFYKKLGFYQVEEIQDYYIIDEKKYDSFLYAKYFHGNRGHFTIYTILSNMLSAVWRTVSSPVYSILFQE